MVANAGIAQVMPALECSDEDVQKMFNVNFMGFARPIYSTPKLPPMLRSPSSSLHHPLPSTALSLLPNISILLSVWNCYTAAARQMISQGDRPEGESSYKILGAASIVAFKPFPLLAHYSATKWAVRGLSQVFAMEVRTNQIPMDAEREVGDEEEEEEEEETSGVKHTTKGRLC